MNVSFIIYFYSLLKQFICKHSCLKNKYIHIYMLQENLVLKIKRKKIHLCLVKPRFHLHQQVISAVLLDTILTSSFIHWKAIKGWHFPGISSTL